MIHPIGSGVAGVLPVNVVGAEISYEALERRRSVCPCVGDTAMEIFYLVIQSQLVKIWGRGGSCKLSACLLRSGRQWTLTEGRFTADGA